MVTSKDVMKAYYKKMMMGCDPASGYDATVISVFDLSVGYVDLRPRKKVESREVQWEPAQIEGEVSGT